MVTHEAYVQAVAEAVIRAGFLMDEERDRLRAVKLAYGAGRSGVLGVTIYRAWKNGKPDAIPFVEIGALTQQSWPQVAITVIHELGHVLAGPTAGHGRAWKDACGKLGFRNPTACDTARSCGLLARLAPDLRMAIAALPTPTDGQPIVNVAGPTVAPKPCSAGVGTRGGRSRGPGSGSRLLKCECGTCGYTARVTRKWIEKSGAPYCPVDGQMNVGE